MIKNMNNLEMEEIEFEIINDYIKKHIFEENEITIKILLKNNSDFNLSSVHFDIRFYDKDGKLIDATKKLDFNVNAHSERIEEINYYTNCNNIESYEIYLAEASKEF